MDTTQSFDPSRLATRLRDLLSLEELTVVCPGFVRAIQVLKIGDEEITRDRVLIEEYTYLLPDEMNAEVNSMTIKMGMFQPFLAFSTYPPKYYYTDRSTLWLVTSVPPVSLHDVLEEFERRFPPHYTWDRLAWLGDLASAVREGVRTGWGKRRQPLTALREGVRAYRERKPQRLTPGERMRFAAFLVDAVRKKHVAGIYHNNITPHTVFFSAPGAPRFLNNYTGGVPSVMQAYIPGVILKPRRDSTFGDQSVDTYSLALITYELVTGRKLAGPSFLMDEPLEVHVPAVFQKPLTGWLSSLNAVLDVLREAYSAVAHTVALMRATFDESRWGNYRVLVRASGSIFRCLPGIRAVTDVWFPTDIAFVLRSILDSHWNERLFGPRSRLNRSLRIKRNANLAYLRAALPSKPFSPRGPVGRVIEDLLNRSLGGMERGTTEDDSATPLRFRPARSYLWRYAITALALVLTCAWSSGHTVVNRVDARAVAGDTTSSGGSCTARLLPSRKYPGVYRLSGMRRRCRTAEIVFAAAPDDTVGTPLMSLGSTYVLLYAAKRRGADYGEIIPIRPCPSVTRGCENGEFYRVSESIIGLGERYRFSEHDLVAFERGALKEFLDQRRR